MTSDDTAQASRKGADLEYATAQLHAAGIAASWIAADCAGEDDIRRLAGEATERLGNIDILINNSGAAWADHGDRP